MLPPIPSLAGGIGATGAPPSLIIFPVGPSNTARCPSVAASGPSTPSDASCSTSAAVTNLGCPPISSPCQLSQSIGYIVETHYEFVVSHKSGYDRKQISERFAPYIVNEHHPVRSE